MTAFRVRFLGALALVAVSAGGAQAQGLSITPMFGGYTQASSFQELRSGADSIRVERESKLALGAAVGLGPLRAGLAYVTGATLNGKGIQNGKDIGEGKLLVGSLDAMVRPIPRLVGLQPYLVGGIALKDADYSFNDDRFRIFDKSETDAAFHIGIGADWMFGPIGIMAEISDYISGGDGDADTQHDAFGMLGVRFALH